MAPIASEADLVVNVVWTGDAFDLLHHFVVSQMRWTTARYRFIVNACTPESTEEIESFAAAHPDRVVEVLEVSRDTMVGHGHALDHVLDHRDDGPVFAFADVDIAARGPFFGDFLATLEDHDAVTSGAEVWTDGNVVDEAHLGVGVGGRHFFHPNGFVYGSPHFGLYRRAAIDETRSRWGVGFGTAGNELSDPVRAELERVGHLYLVYDTGKVINILLQTDGASLVHEEDDRLVHVGGVSHFLAPPEWDQRMAPGDEPTWTTWAGMEPRAAVARYTADAVRARRDGLPLPELPEGTDPDLLDRMRFVGTVVAEMMEP